MRLLVVQESDWIERGPHQSHHLMERLVQRGHEVRVIDYPIGWEEHRDEGLIAHRKVFLDQHKVVDGGVTVVRPGFVRVSGLNYMSLYFTHRKEIKRQIKEFKPDVMIGFGLVNARSAIKLGKRYGVPFIYYIIDELHRLVPEEFLQPIAREIEKKNNASSAKVLTINEGLKEYSIAMGADPAKTEVLRAGVDFERFSKADGEKVRKRYGFSKDDTVLFFMGWLYDFSGLDEVARELAKADNDRIKMLVLGKGELWDKLNQIRDDEGLGDRLILEGWKPYDEVPNYVAAADICLLPAKRSKIMENIVPIKMYEYMAAGKAVLATGLSGIMKEFGQDNGVLYLNESKDAVAVCADLVGNGQVHVEGKKAQAFVSNNDWSDITSRFEEILEEVARS